MNDRPSEKEIWERVKDLLGERRVELGPHWTDVLSNNTGYLSVVLSRYKFAAKMCSKGRRILELNCGEGIGAPFLSEFADSYLGIDKDDVAIESAMHNWVSKKVLFLRDDFPGKVYGVFDAIVLFDFSEQVPHGKEEYYLATLRDNLDEDGLVIVGMKNNQQELNRFDIDSLKNLLSGIFHNVFVFSLNDEIVQAGYRPTAHYHICIGYYRKSGECV